MFFLPLGFLLAYRCRLAPFRAMGVGAAVSGFIELAQGTGLFGLMPCAWRLASVDDLISNSVGALLGAWIGAWVASRFPEPRALESQA